VSDHTTSIFRKVKVKRKKRSISDKDREFAKYNGRLLISAIKIHNKHCPCALPLDEELDAAIRAERASRKESK
jgi:hypothetical protein